jgi:hypothetical protein
MACHDDQVGIRLPGVVDYCPQIIASDFDSADSRAI